MESQGSELGPDSNEASFSSYCSNTVAETATRVAMEESGEQYHKDYDFKFDFLPDSENNVFPLFNCASADKHDHQVEANKKDNVSPPSDVNKTAAEGLVQPVDYKKSKSLGSSSRRWSFIGFRRSNSEREAPARTNNNNKNSVEEKQGEKLGWDRFIHRVCPCLQPKVAANSIQTQAEEVDDEKVVEMGNKISFKKDNVSSPLKVNKLPVHYKKSNSVGSLSRQWSLKGFLLRSKSERVAPTNTEEEKQVEKLAPCLQPTTLPANSLPSLAEEVENKFSSRSSSSTGSDGSNNRVFPINDQENFPLDENQNDNVEVIEKHDDPISSEVESSKEVKYRKSKSTGTLSRRWNLRSMLRRSSSERKALRSTKNIEEEEEEGMFSRCFSLSSSSSRSSSKASTSLLEGKEIRVGSEGCLLHLCPCLSLPPVDSTQRRKEADQHKAVVVKGKTNIGCKKKISAELGTKIQNINAHKKYSSKNSKSRRASTPYRQESIGFFPIKARVMPLISYLLPLPLA